MSILGGTSPGTHRIITYAHRGTADVTAAIAAPGTTKRIVVTGIGYHVETAESNKVLSVIDTNSSAITVYVIPLTTAGVTNYIPMHKPLTVNKALKLDTDGTTGKWSILINYYLETMG